MATTNNLEFDCRWHFAKRLGGLDTGPNNPMQENFKRTPYASLIRESIQNSLDVPLDSSKPVRMQYSISSIDARNYPNFFELQKHIQGCLDYFPNNNDAKTTYKPMVDYFESLGRLGRLYYIKVSDYNTTGMKYIKEDTNNPFYAFVRAGGVSAKANEGAGGSYGYGKAAYYYISPIRTVFVSTKTPQGLTFFEGAASLCSHKVDGDKLEAVGYYDNNNGEPTVNSDRIPNKFKRVESGTDVFIMGIDASDKESIYKQMTEAVLCNFWMAIVRGKLEVTINDETITQNNLSEWMDRFFPDEHDTARREKKMNPRPYYEAVVHAGEDSKHIHVERDFGCLGKVSFYAFKNKNATDKIVYMRRPLMLVKARRTQSSNGFYGVFVCEGKGNDILRRTEDAAHNDWSRSIWRDGSGRVVKQGVDAVNDVERFIIEMMEEMFSNRERNVQNITGLEEYLYIPTAVDEDDDTENESLIGEPISKREDEGSALSTSLSDIHKNTPEVKPAIGKVMVECTNTERHTKDAAGGELSGHGTRKKKTRGGGGVTSHRIDSHYSESEDGVEGQFLTEVPVTYRSFAQTEGGRVVHTIVIHSDYEFENGRIDLLVGGEQSDDTVTITSCSVAGHINANTISGLHFNKGKNVLKVKFADNMKHAVKLDAYELK